MNRMGIVIQRTKVSLLDVNKHLLHFVYRGITNLSKHYKTQSKQSLKNNYLGIHRVLDPINPPKPPGKKERMVWKKRDIVETEKKNYKDPKISFSHRAVDLRCSENKWKILNEQQRQMKINTSTNYFIPKVYKLKPSQISQSIKIRSKLAKLQANRDLQPKIYPKSSIYMQKHLRLIRPCENYDKRHSINKTQDPHEQDKKGTAWKAQDRMKTQSNSLRNPEKTSSPRIGFLQQAFKLVNNNQKIRKDIMNPLNNLMKYAKNIAKSRKS